MAVGAHPYILEDFKEFAPDVNPFHGLELASCRRCGLGWASPFRSQKELEIFYAGPYRSRQSPQAAARPIPLGVGIDPRSLAQIMLARTHHRPPAGAAFLDIGPGFDGRSFRALDQVWPGMRYFAFEPDPGSRESLAQRLGVEAFDEPFPGDRRDDLAGGRRFELVLMSHVLEHFSAADVQNVLENVRDLLAEDGLLVCEVPHCDLRVHAGARRSDSPHLTFFSLAALSGLGRRAGLEVIFAATCGQAYASLTSGQVRPGSLPGGGRARRAASRLPAPLARRAYPLLMGRRLLGALRSPEFDYGGDRTCLRMVARRRGPAPPRAEAVRVQGRKQTTS